MGGEQIRYRNSFVADLSNQVAAAIMTMMLFQECQDMVHQAQGGKPVNYCEVRDKVSSSAGVMIQRVQPTPMDIGAFDVEKSLPGETLGETATETVKVNVEIN